MLKRFHQASAILGGSGLEGTVAPAGAAVDASGDLYVADNAHSVIDKFGPGGNLLSQIEDSEHLTSEMGTIALDSNGNLYVDNLASNVIKFDAAGTFVSVFASEVSTGVAVDPTTNDVYVGEGSQTAITEYESTGTLRDAFASNSPSGLAVNGATGAIYAGSLSFGGPGAGNVTIFGPALVVPDVGIEPATEVTETTAVLHGEVDPDAAHGGGEVTGCEFEVVTQRSFDEHPENPFEGAVAVPCVPATTTVPTEVSASFSPASGTAYRYRLTARNAVGASQSADAAFTTSGAPAIAEELATARARNAIVHAKINPFGFATTCEVQYVSASGFAAAGYNGAKTAPCQPANVGQDFSPHEATAQLTGLSVATTYHYRFLARNQFGPVVGEDATFETFGITNFSFASLDSHGEPYTQAGGHPYRWVTNFDLATSHTVSGELATNANLRDVHSRAPTRPYRQPKRDRKVHARGAHELRMWRLDAGWCSAHTGNTNTVRGRYLQPRSARRCAGRVRREDQLCRQCLHRRKRTHGW